MVLAIQLGWLDVLVDQREVDEIYVGAQGLLQ